MLELNNINQNRLFFLNLKFKKIDSINILHYELYTYNNKRDKIICLNASSFNDFIEFLYNNKITSRNCIINSCDFYTFYSFIIDYFNYAFI